MTWKSFYKTGEKLDYHSFEWRNHIDDMVFGPDSRESEQLKELLTRYPVQTALDVACGNGDTAIFLAAMGKNVTAMDQDISRIKRVHLKSILAGVQLETACGDMRDLSSVYRHKCNLIMCLQNSLSRLIDEADIWGTLAQMYLALEPGGLLVIQMFDYDRLFQEKRPSFSEICGYNSELGVKTFFEYERNKSNAKFIFEVSSQYSAGRKADRIVFPVRPIFQKELDMWLAELGFRKLDNCEEVKGSYISGETWQTVTAAFRPGVTDNH